MSHFSPGHGLPYRGDKMIILSTSTETLNVETRTEATVDVVVTYVDHTPTSYLANGTQTTITTAANTVIVPAAAAGTQRIVKFLSLCNRGIMIAQVSLIHTINGTPYLLTALVTLRPGESMIYHDDHWVMYDWNGRPREPSEMHMNLDAVVRHPLASQVVVNTGTRLLPSGTTVATYMGRAPRQATRIGVRYRITTASAALTWGEIAIATGVPSLGNNATLTVVGYNGANNPLILSSPGGTAISNGVFTSLVTLAPNYTIQQG
jgi:hypothetical protein